MPDTWFRSEYECEFSDTIDSVFRSEDIERAFSSDVAPLFAGGATSHEGNRQIADPFGGEPLFA